MLIRRCEWHRMYWGDFKILGIVWERREWWRISTTGGLCRACGRMFRAINGLPQRAA